ncbi:DNA-binding response regulator [Bacteroidetes/Chlorobi group bacterium ChocPot_Mid]|nr:MAG: DNA-binding response regulator [Bacteroidetes/Chlorobi group bacterium ChocPot_Mid]
MMKIAIADDHAIVRKGLKLILETEFGDVTLDESSSGDELIDLVRHNNYDLIILDISMPGKDVLDTLKDLKDLKPNIPILIFSMNPEKAYAVRMLKSGASGYINKDCSHEELIEAIKKVISGRGYISSTLSELLASEIREGSEKPIHQTLTDREFQIFCMIASGNSLDEIAEKLFLSKNTISNHRNNIMKKLKLKNNAEITAYAMKNEIVI